MPYMQPGAPMYGYPNAAGYPPAAAGRGGPMMGYPNQPNMMRGQPRYAPAGNMPPQMMPGYPGYGPYPGQPAGRVSRVLSV